MVVKGLIGMGTDMRKRIAIFLLMMIAFSISKGGVAAISTTQIVDGYSGCSWKSNGDGTSTIQLTMKFRNVHNVLSPGFMSRAVLVYGYLSSGSTRDPIYVKSISMGGVYTNFSAFDFYRTYHMYHGLPSVAGSGALYVWRSTSKSSDVVKIVINDSDVKNWPAISVQAGYFMRDGWDHYRDSSGAAYINQGDSSGTCNTIVDPTKPPPLPINITVTAPDWDLGELPVGEGSKILSSSSEALCFSYAADAVSGKRFSIDASGANDTFDKRYRLKNVDDDSQYVPYNVQLNSGSTTLNLPNVANAALAFSKSGKTCFIPTFRTTVERRLKAGMYNDVLTFTVTTKS